MIDHIGISVSNLPKSKEFYSTLLATLGYEVRMESADTVGYGVVNGHGKSVDPGGDFWIFEGTPQTPRAHIAFSAASRKVVDDFHNCALLSGATNNGAAGLRPHYHVFYYSAYILDLDGYNIEAEFHLTRD